MRILLLANSDLASNYTLNLLLPQLQGHELKLLLSSSVGGTSQRAPELQQLKFFEQQLFNDLIFPLLAQGSQGAMTSFSGFTPLLVAPAAVENEINSANGLARVAAFAPDLVIYIRYGGILKDKLIALPRRGVINLHSGKLPQYRGVMATFWAMLAGDELLGTTLHTIEDASIDTGRVIATTETQLVSDQSYLWNVLNLYRPAVAELLTAIAILASGEALPCQAQRSGGAYYSFPTQQELARFTAMGYSLFNPAETIAFAREHYLSQ